MDRSRLSTRTVVVALLCLAVIAFAAATLDSTTQPDSKIGAGNPGTGEQLGGDRTPADTPSGDSDGGRASPLNLDMGGAPIQFCVVWLKLPMAQVGLLLGLLGLFMVGRWYDDAALGLGLVVLVGYPGFFVYLLLTACHGREPGFPLDLGSEGRPSQQGGGLFGGAADVTTPSLVSRVLLVVVLALLGVVAVLVLTGDHDQTEETTEEAPDEEIVDDSVDVAAIGAAAGRAADRIEHEGEFENEVFRAWAEMTEPLAVDSPESSTPAEFATAAVNAGMDPGDVDRLTGLFEDIRYGGADPTPEREAEAVEILRRIEAAYGGEQS